MLFTSQQAVAAQTTGEEAAFHTPTNGKNNDPCNNRTPPVTLTQAEIPVAPNEMPDYILEQLKKDPFVKEHFGWKLAFCQHPMYLLIDEDRGEPTVGE